MKAEPIPGSMERSPHDQFRPRVGGANASHVGAALPGIQPISHRPAILRAWLH
jgi:hypothetical protein